MNSAVVQYVVLVCVVIAIIIYAYLRLTYGFWFYQPVFHLYDLRYYLSPCGIVEHDLPERNKFTNLENITTTPFHHIVRGHRVDQFTNFVRTHYLRNRNNRFLPTKTEIVPYFTNHKHPCFVSFYQKPYVLQVKQGKEHIDIQKPYGVMTSRPLQISMHSGKFAGQKMYAYYVDHLCVHKDARKQGIAPEIIQTHYYNQRRANPRIHANLFKREGDLTGIVPVCIYPSVVFHIPSLLIPFYGASHSSHEETILKNVRCIGKNLHFLINFLRENANLFDIQICSDLGNFTELLQTNNYVVEYVVDCSANNDIVCVFFFKKMRVFLDTNQEAISCIASIKKRGIDDDVFGRMFLRCLHAVNTTCSHIIVEALSHNTILVEECKNVCSVVVESPTAYFFHNFVCPTFSPDRVLILGT